MKFLPFLFLFLSTTAFSSFSPQTIITDAVSGNTAGVTASNELKVIANSIPLPPLAATSTLQTAGNASLASIVSNTTGLALDSTLSTFSAKIPALTATGSSLNVNVTGGVSGNASIGLNTAAIPTSSTQVGGKDGSGNLQPLKVSSTGVLSVDGSAVTQPMSVSSLPLPTGAATSVLQGTGNTSLASIDSKTPSLGQALSAASVPVVLPVAQITALTPPAAITGFALESGHLASIDTKLTSPLAVTGVFFQATQPVSGSLGRSWTLNSGTDSVTISGSVTASNASIGLTGSAVPTSATLIAGKDGSGNLKAPTISSGGAMLTDGTATTQPISASALPLPSGASTLAAQTTGNSSLSSIDSKTPALGQALAASSVPVVLTAAQLTTLTPPAAITGFALEAGHLASIDTKLTSPLSVTGTFFQATQPISAASLPLPTGGSTSALQTTGNTSLATIATNSGTQATAANQTSQITQETTTASNTTSILANQTNGNLISQISQLPADKSPATQNITVQDTASTTTPVANGQNFITGTPTAGSVATFSIPSAESIEVQATGTWTGTLAAEVSQDGGTTWVTRGIKQSGSSYLGSSFTQNFQGGSNFGGMNMYRVRATAAMTGTATIKVTSSLNPASLIISNPQILRDATTQSITNTIKAASTLPLATDTALVVTLRDSAAITAASLPLPTGAAADATLAKLTLAQASTTSGQTGPLIQGAVTTAAPSYSTGQTSPLSLTLGGALRTDSTTLAGVAISTGNGVVGTGVQRVAIASDNTAFNVNAIQSGTWNVTSSGGALALDASVTGLQVAQASTTSGQKGGLILGAVTTAAPTYVTGNSNALSLTTAGALRVDGSGVTQPVSGTVSTTNVTSATDVASAAITVTATTAAFTPSVTANSQQFVFAVTAVSGTTPTLDIVIQESADGGTNWFDRYHMARITATGYYVTPFLRINGTRVRYIQTLTGTTPSFTRSIVRNHSTMPGSLLYVFRNRTLDLTSSGANTPAWYAEGCTQGTLFINTGGTNVSNSQVAVQGSDDNLAWVDDYLFVSTAANGNNINGSNSMAPIRFLRGHVDTGVALASLFELVISCTGP